MSVCSADRCEKNVWNKGLCGVHYQLHFGTTSFGKTAKSDSEYIDDLVLLETIDVESIVDVLCGRHAANEIYTYIGT